MPALLFIRGIAETADLAKLAEDYYFLTRLAFAGLASRVISTKDQEWAAKAQKGLVWISLNCAEWQPLCLPDICLYLRFLLIVFFSLHFKHILSI